MPLEINEGGTEGSVRVVERVIASIGKNNWGAAAPADGSTFSGREGGKFEDFL